MASIYKETNAFIRKYGDQVEQEIEKRLTTYGKIATHKLYDSIRYEVKETKAEFILTFEMLEYGKFVDKGVKPQPKYLSGHHKPQKRSKFIEALQKWCKVKGIPVGAAFPIRRSIWKYGIAPTNFFTIPTTRRQKQYEKGLAEAMARDIDNNIQQDVDKR